MMALPPLPTMCRLAEPGERAPEGVPEGAQVHHGYPRHARAAAVQSTRQAEEERCRCGHWRQGHRRRRHC